jgi:hypothetical protein
MGITGKSPIEALDGYPRRGLPAKAEATLLIGLDGV